MQIFLPVGAEIEVYNVGALISRRFIPIDTETFLKNVDSATWSSEKFAAIEDFMNSYAGTTKTPKLLAKQLGLVIHDFMMSEEKFKALRRLHRAVMDRENLGSMIESEFNYFDRDQARQIVGL